MFPTWLLLEVLDAFGREYPDVRLELYESVLGGTEESLHEGRVELAIGSRIPPGFKGEPLLRVRFICCAAPDHPLHRLARPLTLDDLKLHRYAIKMKQNCNNVTSFQVRRHRHVCLLC